MPLPPAPSLTNDWRRIEGWFRDGKAGKRGKWMEEEKEGEEINVKCTLNNHLIWESKTQGFQVPGRLYKWMKQNWWENSRTWLMTNDNWHVALGRYCEAGLRNPQPFRKQQHNWVPSTCCHAGRKPSLAVFLIFQEKLEIQLLCEISHFPLHFGNLSALKKISKNTK